MARSSRPRAAQPPVLLALRALGLGDLLVAVPALRAIARSFPGHRLLLALPAWLHPLTARMAAGEASWHPVPLAGLGERLPADLPRVEVAVNLHGNGARSAEMLDALTPALRIGHRRPGWPGPEWVPEMPERSRWCRLLIAHGIAADETDLYLPRPTEPLAPDSVLVHPGAGYRAKQWPIARFAEVAGRYATAGRRVLVTGSAAERGLASQVATMARLPAEAVLAGRTSVTGLAALVASAGLVISGDTGIAHLAFAFGTPSVTLYGPVDARRWGPPRNGPHRALQHPEHRNGDPFADRPDPALLAVDVDEVLAASAEVERVGRLMPAVDESEKG